MREVRGPYPSKSNTHAPRLVCFFPLLQQSDWLLVPTSIFPVPSAFFSLQTPFLFASIQILIFRVLILDFSPSLCFHRVNSIRSGRNRLLPFPTSSNLLRGLSVFRILLLQSSYSPSLSCKLLFSTLKAKI